MLPIQDVENSYGETVEIIPENRQVKVNHLNCDAGTDTKKRLYITNKGGVFMWHCFHCNQSGWHKPKEHYSAILGSGASTLVTSPSLKWLEIFNNAIPVDKCDSTEARLWCASYGMLDGLYFRYSPEKNAVVLPVHHSNAFEDELVGIQLRNFTKGKTKYSTFLRKQIPGSYRGKEVVDTLVFVEDLMSAAKLRKAGHNSFCLLGTSLGPGLIPKANKAVIWLDPDTAGHAGAQKLYREIAPLYNDKVTVVYNTQPKEVPMYDLEMMEF